MYSPSLQLTFSFSWQYHLRGRAFNFQFLKVEIMLWYNILLIRIQRRSRNQRVCVCVCVCVCVGRESGGDRVLILRNWHVRFWKLASPTQTRGDVAFQVFRQSDWRSRQEPMFQFKFEAALQNSYWLGRQPSFLQLKPSTY
jgi:hypothetical protein